MADIAGLFAAPEDIQRARILQEAQLTPNQRLYMMGAKTGQAVGQGLGSLFGVDVQDPAMARASKLRELGAKYGTTTAEALDKIAADLQQTDPQMAMQVAQKAQEMKLQSSKLETERLTQTQKATQTAREQYAASMENKLRDELAALGPDATEEDMLKVVVKYGGPDKVLATLQAATSKREATQQLVDDAKARLEANIQMAKDRNATQVQLEQMRIEGRKEIAQLTAALKGSQPKSLPAGLQKSEDDDLAKIDAFSAQRQALQPAINALTPDPQTGKSFLELGPVKNAGYAYQLATGQSTPQARAFENLKSAVDTAVNIQVSAEKGVQTDKDVLRFAQALIAAYGRNDTKATLEALKRFNEASVKAEEQTQKRINSRRKSQGVEAYYPEIGAAKETPPAETPKKATKRFNPATGQIEAI
jgi:hypothetical protein